MSDAYGKMVQDEGFLRMIKSINSRVNYAGAEEFSKLLEQERKDLKALYDSLQTKK